ncbi:MAG: FAD-linked oxidase C-terminal domain-containing protein [Polyangiaceae bacterium]
MRTFEPRERTPASAIERVKRELSRALGDSKLVVEPDALLDYGRDESENDPMAPDLVVRAETSGDIEATLRIASACDVPVTPRAAGSGKSGGAIPTRGGIVLTTLGLRSIVEIDRGELVAVVEPGVILADLHEAVEREGLFYPPDANSLKMCALGGNLAENAGGPRAFKYGVTRDYLRGMEVVLMGGQRIVAGRRTKKGVTGYDVTALLVGSEGTLAVTTRATLALLPKPDAIVTMLALFHDVHASGRATAELVASGIVPRCIELLDASTLAAVRSRGVAVDPSAGAMLIIEADGSEPECDRAMERLGEACVEAGALDVLVAKDEAQRERLWEARRTLSYATRAMAKHKVSEDVVVPRGSVPALLGDVDRIASEESVRMLTYGHAGDGNLHVNLLWNDVDEEPRIRRALEKLFRAVVARSGTLTGEHGVGLSKAPYLGLEQSAELIELQRQIKGVFDPKGLLNPDKIFAGARAHGSC